MIKVPHAALTIIFLAWASPSIADCIRLTGSTARQWGAENCIQCDGVPICQGASQSGGGCSPGQKLASGGGCIPIEAEDCGNGQFCAEGHVCTPYGCMPKGSVDCGTFYCKSGSRCSVNRQMCVSPGDIDCGAYTCGPGKKCASGWQGCLNVTDVDCGTYSCGPGKTCASGRKACLSPTDVDCGTYICEAGSRCASGRMSCIPAGGIDCGTYSCGPGKKCASARVACLDLTDVDCGTYTCEAGSRCAAYRRACIPAGHVDCGSYYCKPGETCGLTGFGGPCVPQGDTACRHGLVTSCGPGTYCSNSWLGCLRTGETLCGGTACLAGFRCTKSQSCEPVPNSDRFDAFGNGFVAGVGWIVGFNVQTANPAVIAKSKAMLRQLATLANYPYNEAVDFAKYNFVVGIAASTNNWIDISKRAVFDELHYGPSGLEKFLIWLGLHKYTEEQATYNYLRGRRFYELGCYSNGAMICLSALQNQDTKADRVALYGPQITIESLKLWDELVRNKQVKGVEIFINQNDPVPGTAMVFSTLNPIAAGERTVEVFKADVMVRTIHELAPELIVRTFPCGNLIDLFTLGCHDMAVYKRSTGCQNHSATRPTAPGTALPGRGSLLEPPPPC
jgi:hypothetical protein